MGSVRERGKGRGGGRGRGRGEVRGRGRAWRARLSSSQPRLEGGCAAPSPRGGERPRRALCGRAVPTEPRAPAEAEVVGMVAAMPKALMGGGAAAA